MLSVDEETLGVEGDALVGELPLAGREEPGDPTLAWPFLQRHPL